MADIVLLWNQLDDPDSFENWEKLVRAAESLEGGINRNSSPQSIVVIRDTYDRFLAKFPLLFGYWKKYADLEFSIAGTEAAELVRDVFGTEIFMTKASRSTNEALPVVSSFLCASFPFRAFTIVLKPISETGWLFRTSILVHVSHIAARLSRKVTLTPNSTSHKLCRFMDQLL